MGAPRRWLTHVFTDIEGSTRLWDVEPKRMGKAMALHDSLAFRVVKDHAGRLVKSTGDGWHGVFDEPLNGLYAALDFALGLADISASVDLTLSARCGLNTGAAAARSGDYFGTAVNRAARIMSSAHGGQVLVGQATAEAVKDRIPDEFGLRDLGRVRLRDLESVESVYQLLHARLRDAFPTLRGLDAIPSNLPRQATSFFGRKRDLAEAVHHLGNVSLLTIVGPGGIGKTRLACELAAGVRDGFEDGVWFVELAQVADPSAVPVTVAQTLGLRIQGSEEPVAAICKHLATHRLLLVLDNCEHVVQACARLVGELLKATDRAHAIATSREPLGLTGEQVYHLNPLELPDATMSTSAIAQTDCVRLFVDRARLCRPDFEANDTTLRAVARVCTRLDGIPLALELAAARMSVLTIEALEDRLSDRFGVLQHGSRTALPRQQTLAAAIDWSYDLLTDAEKLLFRRLSAFTGGWSLELAEQVCSQAPIHPHDVLGLLCTLVQKSMILSDVNKGRFRMLESLREYARAKAADELPALTKRHAQAMRKFLKRVDDENLDGNLRTDQYEARVLPELDNLRTAYAWAASDKGDSTVAVALAAHAGALVDYTSDCQLWLLAQRSQIESAAAADRATAARYSRALAAGNMNRWLTLAEQREFAARAVDLYSALGHPRRLFSSLIRLARCSLRLREDAASSAALERARALLRPDWPAEFHIHFLRLEVSRDRSAGRLTDALALQQEEVRAARQTRDWRLEVMARANLSDLLWESESLTEAAAVICSLIEDLRRKPAAPSDYEDVYVTAIGILTECGRVDEASDIAAEALPLMRRLRWRYLEAWIYLFWRRNQPQTAAILLGFLDADKSRMASQPNESRLVDAARIGLTKCLSSVQLGQYMSAGSERAFEAVVAIIGEALLGPDSAPDDREFAARVN